MGIGLDRDRIERTIQSGKIGSNMPAFAINQGGSLRAPDIKLIVEYIETWESLGAAPALPSAVQETMIQPLDPAMLASIVLPTILPVHGNAEQGALLFRIYCVDCHGSSGHGGSGPPLVRDWTGVRPDLMLSAMISQGVPGTTMRAWGQDQGGPLDNQALNDLVTFLLSQPASGFAHVDSSAPPAETSSLTWDGWSTILFLLAGSGLVGIFVAISRSRRK